jgi:hypothetical protein
MQILPLVIVLAAATLIAVAAILMVVFSKTAPGDMTKDGEPWP